MPQPLINISRKHALAFAAFLVLYEFLTYIANDMIMPGMIMVIKSFHGHESDVAKSLTAYILGGSSLQLILGPLSDRYGRRPVMLSGAVLFLICTIIITQSHSIQQFILFRFFQGMGLCFIGTIGYTALQEIFTEMDAVKLIAIMASTAIISPLIGPVLGAVLIAYLSWKYIFIVISIFAIIALWGLWEFMPETIGTVQTNGRILKITPFTPKIIINNYKLLLQNQIFLFGTIGLALLTTPCLIWIALAPIILIKHAHLSIITYAIWQIPIFGATILGNYILHKLTKTKNIKQLISLGTHLTLLSLALTALLPLIISDDYIWLMPGLIFYSFNLGIVAAPLNRFILFVTTVSKGTASAIISFIIMVIEAISIEVGNIIYNTSYSNTILGMYCLILGLLFYIFTLYILYKDPQ